MLYDLIRWGVGLLVFVVLSFVISSVTKKKGKSVLISSFIAVILCAVTLLIPVENAFYRFPDIHSAYEYRYHESLVAYAECEDGAVCVGDSNGKNDVYYSFECDEAGYKMPWIDDTIVIQSSEFGVYIFRYFGDSTIIITQVPDSAYCGEKFAECNGGHYTYTVVKGVFNPAQLTCKGEKIKLV